jgi:beta-glucanase (GH16 family)
MMKGPEAVKQKTSLLIVAFFIFLGNCCTYKAPPSTIRPFPYSATTGDKATWDLVWSDEFDYAGLPDPLKWGYEAGYVRNNELQYYTRARLENARVQNGFLIIEVRKESSSEHDYTSASVSTKHKAMWIHGRIEVRAKLPTGKGMWPAIFTLGSNIDDVGWAACGEIDIMENVGFDADVVHANIHTKIYNHILGTNRGSSIRINKPYENFHVYAIEWFKDRIDFFVDDKKYFTFENEGAGWAKWPFDKGHYLIINAAFGGAWGGKFGVDDTILPQKFYIDYVRVYRNNSAKN